MSVAGSRHVHALVGSLGRLARTPFSTTLTVLVIALALALPDQTTYRNLASRVSWFLAELNSRIYWVYSDGQVTAQEPQKVGAAESS